MNIKQFIEFLQTLPQDATVHVLSHYRDNGYYMQGGSCSVEDFTSFCKAGSQGTNGLMVNIMRLQQTVLDKCIFNWE